MSLRSADRDMGGKLRRCSNLKLNSSSSSTDASQICRIKHDSSRALKRKRKNKQNKSKRKKIAKTVSCDFEGKLTRCSSSKNEIPDSRLSDQPLHKKEEEASSPDHQFGTFRRSPVVFERGKRFDIKNLLFKEERDFLLRNNGDQVKLDQLRHKYIVLFFYPLNFQAKGTELTNKEGMLDLIEAYHVLFPQGDFEVVFVAVDKEDDDNKNDFDLLFSRMPWLAIPYYDREARGRFQLPHDGKSACATLLHKNGTALLCDTHLFPHLACYGAEIYPFTKQKEMSIRHQDKIDREMVSMQVLFGDFLVSISDPNIRINVSELESKVVFLYLYARNGVLELNSVLKLSEKLQSRGKEFVVLVIGPDINNKIVNPNETLYKKARLPNWYALPSSGSHWRKLSRVFCFDSRHSFVALGPSEGLRPADQRLVRYFASDIFTKYGSVAYPFTLKRAAQLEKKRLLTKSMSTALRGCKFLRMGRPEAITTVKSLSKTSVLILYAERSNYLSGGFLQWLEKEYHIRCNLQEREFEIIYVPVDDDRDDAGKAYVMGMPWLVATSFDHNKYPYGPPGSMRHVIKHVRTPAIAAFRGGQLVTKESDLDKKTEWNKEFPFINEDMYEEVLKDTVEMNEWHTTCFPEWHL